MKDNEREVGIKTLIVNFIWILVERKKNE